MPARRKHPKVSHGKRKAALGYVTESDIDYMARTIFGEARNQGEIGMRAVGLVILNRYFAKYRRQYTLSGVCTDPAQFSCWRPNDPGRKRIVEVLTKEFLFLMSKEVAYQCLGRAHVPDFYFWDQHTVGTSRHYHADYVHPGWARGHVPLVTLGDHIFYDTVK